MATCFGPICIVWQPPDNFVPDEPPPLHTFFIGLRIRNVVQNYWLDGEQTGTVLLYDADPDVPIIIETFAVKCDELLTGENIPVFANLSRLLSLVGVPSFYLASVLQVIYSKAVAMAYETTNNGPNLIPIVAEIPFLWVYPLQEFHEDDDDEDADSDEEEDEDGDENEIMDEVVSYSLEDGMDMDMDMDMVVPATKTSIETLEKFKLEGLNSMEMCMICLEQFSMEIEVRRMPCSHVYHGECILQWLNKSHMCPLCRFKMPVDPS